MKSRQRNLQNNFVNFCITLTFLITLTREEEIGLRLGRASVAINSSWVRLCAST